MLMDCGRLKLFVGGISRDTTEEILRTHFNRYGSVSSSEVVIDKAKDSPRGFGFVTFSEPGSADRALQDKHVIDRRTVEVKRAIPRNKINNNNFYPQNADWHQNRGLIRNDSHSKGNNQCRTKKIFVGGLAANVTQEEFRNYFERFGSIIDVVVMHDNITHRPRGFGFVTFDSEDSVNNVLQTTFHMLNGKSVEVKRAVPKEKDNNCNTAYNTRTGFGIASPHNTYQLGIYPPYGHGYGCSGYDYSNYATPPGYGSVGSHHYGPISYDSSGYFTTGWSGGIGSGMSAFPPPGCWYHLPYGNAASCPAFLSNGVGVTGTTVGGYNSFVGHGAKGILNHMNRVRITDAKVPADAKSPQADRGGSNIDTSGLNGSYDTDCKFQDQGGLDGPGRN